MKSVLNLIPREVIESRIFMIRGKKVLLSGHLAELYDVETRVLMQAVKRNIERFPDDFMFTLTREKILRISQIVTSLKYSKAVYAFTEQGVAMLSEEEVDAHTTKLCMLSKEELRQSMGSWEEMR